MNIVAYWENNFGEECSSRVRASFIEPESEVTGGPITWLVVYNWRTCGFIVINQADCITIRHE